MTHRSLHALFFAATAALFMLVPKTAQACAVCFGQSDSQLARGMNWGVFTLLLVVFGVLAAFATFFIFLARRSAAVARQVASTAAQTGSTAIHPARL